MISYSSYHMCNNSWPYSEAYGFSGIQDHILAIYIYEHTISAPDLHTIVILDYHLQLDIDYHQTK